MASYDPGTLAKLLAGTLPETEVHAIQSAHKDAERFRDMLAVHQAKLGWTDRILLAYGDRLYIVERPDGAREVQCACGHNFGDYKVNWKLSASIYVRNTTDSMEELYPRGLAADPEWMELREFYCPGCLSQLEVEAVPPGYPIVFDFEPDLEALEEWLSTTA